jgi:predicted MPP superfamily phosphohydrolase
MMPFCSINRRAFLRAGAAACLGTLGASIYAWRIEPHWVELVYRDLPIEYLPSKLIGETLVQLSDIHVGTQVDDGYLKDSFAIVNDIEPAFVALTGDYMTCIGGEQLSRALHVMEHLRPGRLGSAAVLGNHDYGKHTAHVEVADRLARGLTDQGFVVLRNEWKTIAGLTFVGLDDLWARRCQPGRALKGLLKEQAAVALCHNPDGADVPGWESYSGWILSGHTHGGQFKPPFLTPPRLPVKNRRYVAGEVDLHDGRKLYINRALGHLLRVRFNVRPEITVFRLTRA